MSGKEFGIRIGIPKVSPMGVSNTISESRLLLHNRNNFTTKPMNTYDPLGCMLQSFLDTVNSAIGVYRISIDPDHSSHSAKPHGRPLTPLLVPVGRSFLESLSTEGIRLFL